MTDPSTPQDRAAFRREIRETASRLFSPPSVTWAEPPREPLCVCDALGMCPQGCARCPACSRRPGETAPDPDDPGTWAFPGPPDFSGEWPADLPRFGPVPERIEVTYCTGFCGDSCTCSLAAEAEADALDDGDEPHG